MLPGAVDAHVRTSLSNSAGVIARTLYQAALTSKHAYSSAGDEIPTDDTTAVILRVEDPSDALKGKGCCC